MSEPRKATDILLGVESDVRMLLDIIRAQDLNIKILSNKLNDVIGRLDKQQVSSPKIIMEAVQTTPTHPMLPPTWNQIPVGEPERNVLITAESKLPQSEVPQGFRRSSRPETYAGDNAYLPHSGQEAKMPTQIPKMPPGQAQPMQPPPGRDPSDVLVPAEAMGHSRNNKKGVMAPPNPFGAPLVQQDPHIAEEVATTPITSQGQIPVMQRCVDKNGKSVFLADVEIIDLSSGQPFFKTRTNGTGKWMASLGIGNYRVVIGKRAALNKEKLEAIQNIQVDGSQSPLELPMLIIK